MGKRTATDGLRDSSKIGAASPMRSTRFNLNQRTRIRVAPWPSADRQPHAATPSSDRAIGSSASYLPRGMRHAVHATPYAPIFSAPRAMGDELGAAANAQGWQILRLTELLALSASADVDALFSLASLSSWYWFGDDCSRALPCGKPPQPIPNRGMLGGTAIRKGLQLNCPANWSRRIGRVSRAAVIVPR